MKLIKILTAFIALASLQIAAAQWLHVPPPAEAKNLMVFTAGVLVSAPACATVAQASANAEVESVNFGQFAATHSIGTQFTTSKAMTVCKLIVRLKDGGTITDGTIVAAIYADNASDNITGSAIGGNSAAINATDLTSSHASYTFTGLSAGLSNATKYWIVLTWNGTTDGTNYPFWQAAAWTARFKTGSTTTLNQEHYADRSGWFELYE